MRINLKTLNNRVARRILLLFVAAAAIPLAVLSTLVLYQISSDLKSQSESYLRDNAKSIGMDIFDRLQFLEEELLLISRHLREHGHEVDLVGSDIDIVERIKRIDGLFILSTEGAYQPIHGSAHVDGRHMIETIRDQWVPGKSMLLQESANTATGLPRLFMFVPLDAGKLGSDLLGAELSLHALWDIQQLQDRRERICIISEKGSSLYCNRASPAGWLARVVESSRVNNSGQFTWSDEKPAQLTAYWSIFLAPHYQLDKWTVVIGLPEEQALQAVDKFQMLLPRVVLLTLLVVIFLSIPMIRSNLHPLELLLSATRRLSGGHFDTRIQIDTKDEFQEVGESFNQMAFQLGQQFEHQKLMAELSRDLHQADSVDAAIQTVFSHLKEAPVVASIAAVCLEERGDRSVSRCFPFFHVANLESEFQRDAAPELPDRVWQGSREQMEACYPLLSRLQAQPGWELTLIPAVKDGRVQAVMALLLVEGQSLDQTWSAFFRQAADILAFTLTGIYLDNRLYFQAHHDSLTGLPNRVLLKNRAVKAIEEAQGNDKTCAVVIFDIDRFKLINDSQGHAAGDELLVQIAGRLQQSMRIHCTVSRFAGDEFVILLDSIEASVLENYCQMVIGHVDDILQEPFEIGNWSVKVTASKGIALFPQDGQTFPELLKNADAAMYQAKGTKPGSSAFFSNSLQEALMQKIRMEQDLAGAVIRQELLLHYQPVMNIRHNRVVAAEALVRWQPPGQELIMPGHFIGIAEETGAIEEIGLWVLEKACSDYQAWFAQGIELSHVAVNVSAQQLQNNAFVEQVQRVIERTGIDPSRLELEVTESALIGNFEESILMLQKLRSLGVSIAVDDFGTGYASLKYLKVLPADRLKIDRLFVQDLPGNSRDAAIIASLVSLARELGLAVLVEGVENEVQAEYLLNASITQIQGYLYSRPLPEAAFIRFTEQVNSAATLQFLRNDSRSA